MNIKDINWTIEEEYENEYIIYSDDPYLYVRYLTETYEMIGNFNPDNEEWEYLAELVHDFIEDNEVNENDLVGNCNSYEYYGVKPQDFL